MQWESSRGPFLLLWEGRWVLSHPTDKGDGKPASRRGGLDPQASSSYDSQDGPLGPEETAAPASRMSLCVRVSLFGSGVYPSTSRLPPTRLAVVALEALEVNKEGRGKLTILFFYLVCYLLSVVVNRFCLLSFLKLRCQNGVNY